MNKVNFPIYLSEKDDLDLIAVLNNRPAEFENDSLYIKHLLRKAIRIETFGEKAGSEIDEIIKKL